MSSDGISSEVVDLRTTSPLDEETPVSGEYGPLGGSRRGEPRCSIATDISALLRKKSFRTFKCTNRNGYRTSYAGAFSGALEDMYIPSPDNIVSAVKSVMDFSQ